MRTFFIACLSTVLSIPLAMSSASAQVRDWDDIPWGWHYMWGGVGIGMLVFMFVFWALVIVGVIALIRWLWGTGSGTQGMAGGGETAEDILKKRYSRGEIDKQEFEGKLQDLRRS